MTAARRVTQRQQLDLTDMVDELTRSHPNRERFTRDERGRRHRTRSRYHITRVPSLLHQLEHTQPTTADEHGGSRGFESRPVARLEALDALVTIEHAAIAWLRKLGAPLDGTVVDWIRRLHALTHDLTADTERPTRRRIEADIRRWWTRARIVTGWDQPAWRPANTCPLCGEYGTLRIKWLDEIGYCVECAETWDPDTIGLLADHIRAEADTTHHRPTTACFCPLPKPQVTALRLCPTCGSARCIRALDTPEESPGV